MGIGVASSWARGLATLAVSMFLANSPAMAQSSTPSPKEVQELAELLKHYSQYPEFLQILEPNEKALLDEFKKNDAAALKSLPPEAFKNLYQRFQIPFVGFREVTRKFQKQLQSLKDRKIALPLSETKSIVELDLKIKASEDQLKQFRFVLFNTSFNANKALQEMLNSPSVKSMSKKEESANSIASEMSQTPPKARPKLPGLAQESSEDRSKTAEADKLNLTPVDPEFYNTQLGKKLEKDLGGRAQFWNYDFDQDELYVVVGSEAGKIRVKQKDQSTRIIQTRVGSGFQDFPDDYQGDEAVDLNLAKGRFLTGNPTDPTLFGAFPNLEEPAIPEGKIPAPHKHGHDHNH